MRSVSYKSCLALACQTQKCPKENPVSILKRREFHGKPWRLLEDQGVLLRTVLCGPGHALALLPFGFVPVTFLLPPPEGPRPPLPAPSDPTMLPGPAGPPALP